MSDTKNWVMLYFYHPGDVCHSCLYTFTLLSPHIAYNVWTTVKQMDKHFYYFLHSAVARINSKLELTLTIVSTQLPYMWLSYDAILL